MAETLHLLVPGLLGPWTDAADPAFPHPQTPALQRLLAQADVITVEATGLEATLFWLFGITPPPDRDLPVAAVTRLADGGDGCGWWLRADPVHLHADLHQVLLADARRLDLEPAEAHALADACNGVFADAGLRLEAPHPCRWYLRLPADPQLRTYPLDKVIGRDIGPRLPEGPQRRRWHTLLTEAQMLLHAAAVNARREARGRPPVNGVWLWGGGMLPQGARLPAARIYGQDPVLCGLARLAGGQCRPVPADARQWRDAAVTDSLVLLDIARYDSVDDAPQRWSDHLAALERDWFAPCRQWLTESSMTRMIVYPGTGRAYVCTPRQRLRFWRRGCLPLEAP